MLDDIVNTLEKLNDEDLLKIQKMSEKLLRKSSGNTGQKKRPRTKDFSVKRTHRGQRQQIELNKNRKNLFDDMATKNMHKDDTEIDKVLAVEGITPRNRQTSIVSVVCMRCEETKEMNVSMVPQERDRFICNHCQTRGGKKL